METDIASALRTAGFALAHGIGSIERGGVLCTLAVVQPDDRQRVDLYRYEARSITEGLIGARQDLEQRIGDGSHGALVYDGYITTTDHPRTDALLVDILGPGAVRLGRVIQTYQSGRLLGLPVIGRRATVLDAPRFEEPMEYPGAFGILMSGVMEHPDGARLFPASST